MENTQVVEAFFADLNQGRTDEAFARVADEVEWWVPGTLPFSGTKTKDEYMDVVAMIATTFPQGLAFEVRGLTAEGDRVAAEVVSLGQHTSGRTYNNHYHFLFILRAGLIVAVREYMDTLHLHDLVG